MSEHEKFAELIPFYASGSLGKTERRFVEDHLASCSACRADAVFWEAVSKEISGSGREEAAPSGPLDRALSILSSERRRRAALGRAFDLLRSQIFLIRREAWPAVAVVTAIGFTAALILKNALIIRSLAPLIAAASLAVIYGPDNDPAIELTLAAPTSPWKILLARLTLVFGYNLILAFASALGLRAVLPGGVIHPLILDWLAPMTFLSAAALVLSLRIGTGNAVAAAYLAWMVRLLPKGLMKGIFDAAGFPSLAGALASYGRFWNSPALLFSLSAAFVAAALWLSNRPERGLSCRAAPAS